MSLADNPRHVFPIFFIACDTTAACRLLVLAAFGSGNEHHVFKSLCHCSAPSNRICLTEITYAREECVLFDTNRITPLIERTVDLDGFSQSEHANFVIAFFDFSLLSGPIVSRTLDRFFHQCRLTACVLQSDSLQKARFPPTKRVSHASRFSFRLYAASLSNGAHYAAVRGRRRLDPFRGLPADVFDPGRLNIS
jgi:hypothetical protein